MLESLKKEANVTYTENGAVAHVTTGSDCLDFFATAGALRRASDEEILARFIRAFTEDKNAAAKLLFYTRDVRGGLGERRVFRVILRWLAANHPSTVRKNLTQIAFFGRWDDLLELIGTPCEKAALALLKAQFEEDLKAVADGADVSLLGKWLPGVNASNAETVKRGKRIARAFGLTDAAYRKALAALRARIRILENNLRERDYTFDYEKQPSRAMFKYRKAFNRNDGERYRAFLRKATTGEAKLHADHVMPYELVEPYLGNSYFGNGRRCFLRDLSEEEAAVLNATWASMPDFGGEENALAIVDTSGSMYWQTGPMPAAVALSLGLYFAERNKGAFKNHFIEFSARPQFIEIKGETFVDRLRYIASFNEVADTNLEAVFDLILNAAVKNDVPPEELPAKLYIISDMEFNCCIQNADQTVFRNAAQAFAEHGYRLPDVVFWNVASRNRQQPVTKNEQGVALVSGCTPRLFAMVAGKTVSPYRLMLDVLENERYADISA